MKKINKRKSKFKRIQIENKTKFVKKNEKFVVICFQSLSLGPPHAK